MTLRDAPRLLRDRDGHESSRVTFLELFFDLVFVFAITQLSHYLLEHLTLEGLAHTTLMFMAVWWVWIYTSWVTNWLDPQTTLVRLMLIALMLAGLVLSTSIPAAFAERGLTFAVAYVFMQVGRCLFTMWALRGHHAGNYRNFQRITAWLTAAAVFWIAGGLTQDDARFALWGVALAIEYVSPSLGFWTPRLGRSTTADWDVSGPHMAERCGLFIIIVLGESILVTGATFAKMAWTATAIAAFAAAFVGAVAMWWVYFNIGAERASRDMARTANPGKYARLAYTYIHIVIVAGILVTAVGDELILAHPSGPVDLKTGLIVIGGAAVFLLGNILFKTTMSGRVPLSHLVGSGLLAALAAATPMLSPLVLGAGTAATLVVVAVWEARSLAPGAAPSPAP